MNQTPDRNSNRNSSRQNSDQQQRGRSANMTPEERQEYLRRLEAQRRAQDRQGSRSSHRRRKRANLNLALTLFLVIICVVLGFSLWQITKNSQLPPSGEQNPNPNIQETTGSTETEAPAETKDPSETAPPETTLPETEAPDDPTSLYESRFVNSADINLGDLILVNYQYEYSLTDTVPVKMIYGNKPTTYGLSTSSHCLTERALNAMNKFADAFVAATDCYELVVNSAYRNKADQQSIYDRNVQQNGEDYAKQYVALAGFSEHHTGMAVDLTFYRAAEGISIPVAQHPNGSWLKEHCAEYGFIIRYPDTKTKVTGYVYEPWHIRYVGAPHAEIIMRAGITMEEYFDLLIPDTYLQSGSYVLYRTKSDSFHMPTDFLSCTVTTDHLGYRIFAFEMRG
jgi:D-alanyl-D-alanine carboxypeptidase